MSAKAIDYRTRLSDFMTEHVFGAEADYDDYRRAAGPADHTAPPIIEELKTKAKDRGLWNLFLSAESGLTNLEYAPLAEMTGWSMEIAPEALNCAAPDTGNMEILHMFGTEQQRAQWLRPLLDGKIRSAFSMTEPAVASSDARNIETTISRDGADYVINGRKWWTSGAADPRCKILIVMGRTNPDAAAHQQQSMVLVPIDTPGVTIVRSTPVFGWQDRHGHCEIDYHNVRVPATNLLGEEGSGFAIAQARLGPGRIHHCMRALGAAERALALMVNRVRNRVAFGRPLAEQGVVQQAIAQSRNEIDQARLLCEKAAWTIDQHGNKEARHLVAMIKAVAPRVACDVIDRAIQVHGAAGVSDDTPLARLYGWHRAMRIFDGPDEVHLRSIARAELSRRSPPSLRRSPEMAVRELPGAWNFRDVADTATALRPGRLFRSSELSRLDDAGRATLRRLGITDVADLRSSREVARRGPGRVPDGIDVHLLPFPDLADDDADDSAPHETAFKRLLTNDGSNGESGESSQSINDAATRYMTDEYRQFPTRNGAQRALHRVVTLLAAGRPVLTHCFAGKDRTGFVVALVLEAVGLDRDVIVADYLRSNDSVPQLRARISEMIQQRFDTELAPEVVTFTKARLSDGVLGVRAEYLAAARQTIDETYGSLGGYLRDAGISQATVNRMRGVLLG